MRPTGPRRQALEQALVARPILLQHSALIGPGILPGQAGPHQFIAQLQQSVHIIEADEFRCRPVRAAAIRPAFETLVMVIAERDRDAGAGTPQAVIAVASQDPPSMMRRWCCPGRQASAASERAQPSGWKTVRRSPRRTTGPLPIAAPVSARGFQTDRDDGAAALLQPARCKWPTAPTKDFLRPREQTDERAFRACGCAP